MKSLILSIVVTLIAVTGCNQSQIYSALSSLEAENTRLTERLDEARLKSALMEQRIAAVESNWKNFEQNFDAGKRQELTKNISATEEMLDQVAKDVESSSKILMNFQELEAEVVKLRDLCIKHESESADANQVGQVKESVANVESSLMKMQAAIGSSTNISQKIQSLDNSLQSVKRDVMSIKSDVGSMKTRFR